MTARQAVQTAAVGLVLLGIGRIWLWDHDARRREAQVAKASADSLVRVITKDRAERAAERRTQSLEAAARLAAADRTARDQKAAADRARGLYGDLVDSLAAMVPDRLEDFVLRLRADWAAYGVLQDSLLAAKDTQIAVRDARIEQLERSSTADLASCQAQTDEAVRQLLAANARAQPGFFRRMVGALPYVAGGIAVWEGLKAVVLR
jgi:hypothetical protein